MNCFFRYATTRKEPLMDALVYAAQKNGVKIEKLNLFTEWNITGHPIKILLVYKNILKCLSY